MIAIQVHVVDTYLDMHIHKGFFMVVTSDQLYLNIILLLSEVAMHARYMAEKLDYHLHHCIESLLLAHFPNGELTL